MATYVSGKSDNYSNALPSADMQRGVCVDVIDLGYQDTAFGPKDQVKLMFELEEQHPDFDGPFRIGKKYTKSLNEKANLRKDLVRWRGRDFTEEELDQFDLDVLIGKPCLITVIHLPRKDGQGDYAAIETVQKHNPRFGEPLKPSGTYARKEDAPAASAPEPAQGRSNGRAAAPAATRRAPVNDEPYTFEQDDELPF